jgi:hypothetical protein
MFRTISLTLVFLLAALLIATPVKAFDPVHITPACVAEMAAFYGVPETILWVIMDDRIEGGRVGMKNPNKNGSFDFGPMQINSVHIPKIAKLTGLSPYDVERKLRWHGCWNVGIGAWVLSSCIVSKGGDFWRGVACYHSNSEKGHRYMRRVVDAAATLFGPKVFQPQSSLASSDRR